MTRYLVVNADDFGISPGVNRGIVDAHRRGIVTSTSLMVNMPGSDEAGRLAREHARLGVGLHVGFDEGDADDCRSAIEEQLGRFVELVGGGPTHVDSHHHVHTRPELLPHFRAAADAAGIPLRAHSPIRYCGRFYGQWGGEAHPEAVGVPRLIQVLEEEVQDGVTELGCHPGYPDPALDSSYAAERELELATLCDPRVRRYLEQRKIALVDFREAMRVLASPA